MKFDMDIDRRSGWPDELCVLLDDYPRQSWKQKATPLAQFWIERHDYFRQQSATLQLAIGDYREQRITPAEFGNRVAHRIHVFLSHLHGHHQLEDFHYFPAFRAAEERLGAGFDVLAEDHELLHKGIGNITGTLNAFVETIRGSGEDGFDEQRKTGNNFATVSEHVCRQIGRHLDDEEDLIIPLLILHGK